MRYLSDNDRALHSAFVRWMGNEAYICYDNPEDALNDVVEMVEEWGQEWIADSTKVPT